MEYRFSDVERLVSQSTGELVRERIAPAAREIDVAGEVPADLRATLGDLGYFGASVPAALGGAEMGPVAVVLAIEQVARGCASTAMLLVASNCLAVESLLESGTPDQQAAWLPALAAGTRMGAGCLAEPDTGIDPMAGETVLRRSPDGFQLHGHKSPAPAAALADLLVVSAILDHGDGHRDPALVLVEPTAPGVTIGPAVSLLGQRACGAAEVSFACPTLPESTLLASGPRAVDLLARLEAAFNLGIAALAVGVATAACDRMRAYSLERRQFGRPIGEFGAIRRMVAQASAEVAAARHLTLHAAAEREAGCPYALLAAEARLVASRTASRVTDRAVQVHGGYGYTKDYAVERHYRDARLLELWAPASEDVCDRLAAGLLTEGVPVF